MSIPSIPKSCALSTSHAGETGPSLVVSKQSCRCQTMIISSEHPLTKYCESGVKARPWVVPSWTNIVRIRFRWTRSHMHIAPLSPSVIKTELSGANLPKN